MEYRFPWVPFSSVIPAVLIGRTTKLTSFRKEDVSYLTRQQSMITSGTGWRPRKQGNCRAQGKVIYISYSLETRYSTKAWPSLIFLFFSIYTLIFLLFPPFLPSPWSIGCIGSNVSKYWERFKRQPGGGIDTPQKAWTQRWMHLLRDLWHLLDWVVGLWMSFQHTSELL